MKKRSFEQAFKPQELAHRFAGKSDFIRYFKESRKSSYFCTLTSNSVAIRAARDDGQQGLPQAGPRRQEEADAAEGGQMGSCSKI